MPAPRRVTQQEQAVEEEEPKPAPGPYRRDTTGLRTDNLPAPPVRRNMSGTSSPGPAPPPRNKPPPALPGRSPAPATGAVATPPRPTAGRPPPVLPPRQNEYPDEYTPPPPPTYGEATQPNATQNAASLNQGAVSRLGQAGVSVPGFGIGNNATAQEDTPSNQGHPNQLNELQQRFARMGTGSSSGQGSQPPAAPTPSWQQRQAPQPTASSSYAGQQTGVAPPPAPGAAAAAKKKPAPPPPPKKSNLQGNEGGEGAPPPIPMSSKPKFS